MEDIEFIIESDSEYEFVIEDDIIEDFKNMEIDPYEYEEEDFEHGVILCIDIGVIHLGLSAMTYDRETYRYKNVVGVDLVDIREFRHPHGMCEETCELNHTKTFTDWMEHVFLYYKEAFENCDAIVIERQPPTGFVVVEQLIFSRYREKTHIVSPNSMHKYFDIGRYSYDQRKECVERLAKKLMRNEGVIKDFESFERKHDMADSICIGYYWLYFTRCKIQEEKEKMIALEKHMKYLENKKECQDYLSVFKYTGGYRTRYLRI